LVNNRWWRKLTPKPVEEPKFSELAPLQELLDHFDATPLPERDKQWEKKIDICASHMTVEQVTDFIQAEGDLTHLEFPSWLRGASRLGPNKESPYYKYGYIISRFRHGLDKARREYEKSPHLRGEEPIPYEEGDVWEQIKAGKFKNKTERQITEYGRNLPGDWRDPNKLWITRAYEVSTPLNYMTSNLARGANAMAKAIGLTRESLKPYAKIIGYLSAGKEGRKSLASFEEQATEDI